MNIEDAKHIKVDKIEMELHHEVQIKKKNESDGGKKKIKAPRSKD